MPAETITIKQPKSRTRSPKPKAPETKIPKKPIDVATFKSPKSRVSESFKELRTNLQFNLLNRYAKAVLITSALPGDGKSWVSSNLAVTFAQNKKKILLVDTDMRRGVQDKTFNITKNLGLSNLLSTLEQTDTSFEDINFEEYISKTNMDNLFILPAGTYTHNPFELLSSPSAAMLIEVLKENFDFIIFDGTPSMLVNDSVVLSSLVDLTVIVARYKSTKIECLKKLKKSIEGVGGKIAGVVLNKVPFKTSEYNNKYNAYYE